MCDLSGEFNKALDDFLTELLDFNLEKRREIFWILIQIKLLSNNILGILKKKLLIL